jgi:hypothetical protein
MLELYYKEYSCYIWGNLKLETRQSLSEYMKTVLSNPRPAGFSGAAPRVNSTDEKLKILSLNNIPRIF